MNITATSFKASLEGTQEDYRQAIATKAQETTFQGSIQIGQGRPVVVTASFFLPRPKSLKKDDPMVKEPTVTQLQRIVLDALVSVMVPSERQITEFTVTKEYARPDRAPEVRISVSEDLP